MVILWVFKLRKFGNLEICNFGIMIGTIRMKFQYCFLTSVSLISIILGPLSLTI